MRGFYITPDGFVQKVKAYHCLADFRSSTPGGAAATGPAALAAHRPAARAMLRRLRRAGR